MLSWLFRLPSEPIQLFLRFRCAFPRVAPTSLFMWASPCGAHIQTNVCATTSRPTLPETGRIVSVSFGPRQVVSSIEEKRTRWQWTHRLFVAARPKTSSGPPSLRRSRRAWRPASTARRSLITRRTASELLADPRALRSRRTLAVSSRRLVRVSATLLITSSGV